MKLVRARQTHTGVVGVVEILKWRRQERSRQRVMPAHPQPRSPISAAASAQPCLEAKRALLRVGLLKRSSALCSADFVVLFVFGAWPWHRMRLRRLRRKRKARREHRRRREHHSCLHVAALLWQQPLGTRLRRRSPQPWRARRRGRAARKRAEARHDARKQMCPAAGLRLRATATTVEPCRVAVAAAHKASALGGGWALRSARNDAESPNSKGRLEVLRAARQKRRGGAG